MAATVEIDEQNGAAPGSPTHNITNLNYGIVDEPNTDYANHPIPVPGNSMTKYNKLDVTNMGGSNIIDNIRIWKSAGAYLTDEGIQTNLRTSGYAGAASYVDPTTTTYTDQTMPVAEPGTANLGIAGSLSGQLVAAGQSDYWKHQLQAGASTPPGNSNQKTSSIKYDEQ